MKNVLREDVLHALAGRGRTSSAATAVQRVQAGPRRIRDGR